MKLAIIGIVGLPAKYGGFETLAENLVKSDSFNGVDEITVYCSGKVYPKNVRSKNIKNTSLVYLPFQANGLSSIIYDVCSITHAILTGHKALLILGVSGAFILPFIKHLFSGKIVINVDGIESQRKKWGSFSRKSLKFLERLSCKYADVIISDNLAVKKYLKKEYQCDSTMIAYGGDQLIKQNLIDNLVLLNNKYELPKDYCYGICRIEPENNIHIILKAFEDAALNLVFIGNWSSSRYGESLFDKYSDLENIILLDPIYDKSVIDTVRAKGSFYIHGHSAGGTNPSLVEAIFYDAKILAFDCEFNKFTLSNTGKYFCNSDELKDILLASNHDYKTHMGLREQYTWSKISKQYYDLLMGKS